MQKTLHRIKRLGTKTLELRLDNLKKDYVVNAEEICNIENQLKLARECELRERTSDMKVFEYLNAEKVTPLLLDLAKRGTCSRRSRRGLVQEDKRMAFVYTHGLFIT